MGVLGDHDCESTLFWLIFGLDVKSCEWNGCILKHHDEREERWIMGIKQRMVWKGYDVEIVQKRIKGIKEREPVCTVFG